MTDIPVSNSENVQDEAELKDHNKEKCSSVDNLIEMLEDDDIINDNNEGISNDVEDDCSQKMIHPALIKQEAMHPDLENIEDVDLDENNMIDDDDDDDEDDEDEDDEYEGNDDLKNDGESSSPKKTKVNKNSMKKKAPEILIPQMVRIILILNCTY